MRFLFRMLFAGALACSAVSATAQGTQTPTAPRLLPAPAALTRSSDNNPGVQPPAAAVATTAEQPQAGVSLAPNPGFMYQLGAADVVRLMVYNEPTLTGEFTVSDSGVLSLPLIGDVPVAGKSVTSVNETITRKFADGYLKDPKISLEVLTYRPFFILGEVQKPGQYPFSNGLTVMNAVATASGFTYSANKKKVFIKHAGEDDERAMPLTSGLPVQPGDTIRIGVRHF